LRGRPGRRRPHHARARRRGPDDDRAAAAQHAQGRRAAGPRGRRGMSRLRTGEWIAAISAVGLFITLFFDWFSVDGHAAGWTLFAPGAALHLSGWGSLGWFMDVLLGLMILGGVALALMNVRR